MISWAITSGGGRFSRSSSDSSRSHVRSSRAAPRTGGAASGRDRGAAFVRSTRTRRAEPTRATRGVADRLTRLGAHHLEDRADQRPRREVLPDARLDVLGVPLEQTLVGVALDFGVEDQPALAVDQVGDQPAQLGGILTRVVLIVGSTRGSRHDPPQELAEESDGERRVAVRGAVDHPLLDQCRSARCDPFDTSAELPGDVSASVRARAELGHRPQILPFLRSEPSETWCLA